MRSPTTTPTALLLIDIQLGLTHPTRMGPSRSTPNIEFNITNLLASARAHNTTHPKTPIHIIHVHHHSLNPTSTLHPSHVIDWSATPEINGRKGVEPLPCAAPLGDELVLTKSVNSAFIGTDLEARLRGLGVKQVVIAGITTEHCVSTSTRMAANLNVVGDPEGHGERGIVLVSDGCAAFGKVDGEGNVIFDGETVHRVEIEILRGEFAECVLTEKVVKIVDERE